ncbi:MAG: DPP IV N-terminal domain-containing protein, partial [Prevotella sp.]
SAKDLSIEDVTSGLRAKRMNAVTPLADGESYAVLKDYKKIIQYSFKTGKQTALLFDADATIGEKVDNIDGFIMSPDGTKMLIQTKTEWIYRRSFKAVYYIYNIGDRKMERLSDGGPQQSPVWSPDGKNVAFVRDNNIFIVKLLYGNAETQVTKDGKRNEVINGIPDWVNEEEFGLNTAMAFNADATMLCWIRYDETDVSVYSLERYKGMNPEHSEYATYPGIYTYKYPKAGERNSKVSLLSYDIKARQTRTMQLDMETDSYIPRLIPTVSADMMLVCTMNRHQDDLRIYSANPRSTVCRMLIKESVPKYVKEEVLEGILVTSSHIVLPSDRSGFMQLYLYGLNGQMQRKLTPDGKDVTDVYAYDEQTDKVFYQSVGDVPMKRVVCSTDKNGKTIVLSDRQGWNRAVFSNGCKYFLCEWSDRNTPFVYDIYSSVGKRLCHVTDNAELVEKLSAYNLSDREFFSFTTSENVTLNGMMIKPADFDPSKKYPVIIWTYGGPGNQQVIDSWSMGSIGQGTLFDHYFVQHGFIVVCVDGRGTGGRGAEFEKSIYMKIGVLEAKDQVETARYLSSLAYIDKDNIGIWGWSYGGFNTLMSMSEGSGIFKAGVAVAPPTDWRFYDTIYTERYMRTPKENPAGYADNPVTRADKLNGRLLICHGLADDNVHPQNTFEYTEALVQADKDFKMNIYTNRNHSIYGGNTRKHLLRQIAGFFFDNLK